MSKRAKSKYETCRGSMVDVLHLCLRTDEAAFAAYTRMAGLFEDSPAVAEFWAGMASEEQYHVKFWRALIELDKISCIPEIFDDMDKVTGELTQNLDNICSVGSCLVGPMSINEALIMAFRLEFYLLHPAFEVLFNYAKDLEFLSNVITPESDYDQHIARFIKALGEFGNVSKELELVGETLTKLWGENKRLARLTNTDYLTGLLNRRGFFTAVQPFFNLALRNKTRVAVALADIDHFKAVNDTHGHDMGDATLKRVADAIKGLFRKSDIVSRFGGEEFIVFMYGVNEDALPDIAEKMLQSIRDSREGDIPCTISVGLSSIGPGDKDKGLTSLIKRADDALYSAKSQGRDRFVMA